MVRLRPRPIHTLREIDAADLASGRGDGVHYPDLGGPSASGWLDRAGAPYILALDDARFYPRMSLAPRTPEGDLPGRLIRRDHGLMLGQRGGLFPDSFGKFTGVHSVVARREGEGWHADLPPVRDHLRGTWLFAEMFYAHFGHALVDTPARLWPFEAGALRPEDIAGVIGQGMLGAGPRGERFPDFARKLLNAVGLPDGKIRFCHKPVQVDRLLVPRRIAPYDALWNPVFSRMMRRAGERLAAMAPGGPAPARIWLSRSRLQDDPRAGAGHEALDTLFASRGFAVVHPQDLPFERQAALMRGATHVAGVVGSQMHLSAFCHREGVRLLTVAPNYFKLRINETLVADIGGSETHALLPIPRPAGVRHKAPWSIGPEILPQLERRIDAWIAGET